MDQAEQLRIYFRDEKLFRLQKKQEEVRKAILSGNKHILSKLFIELDFCQQEFERSYILRTHCREIEPVESVNSVMT